MRAIKENREYTLVDKAQAEVYKARGFDIYDDSGKLIAYGAGKNVPLERYAALEEENKKLVAENKKLKKELDSVKVLDSAKKPGDPGDK